MIEEHNEPTEFPIDGILDLHTFHPGDVKELIPEYLHACREKEIYRVRIIHGKGTGVLRRIVHSCLDKEPLVTEYHLAGSSEGSWGATIAYLARE
ncbi:MAG: Smr/MutS family protein [Gammaproteobacteria bacterium]|nr:Smr/MutS family protein [Gammaproteobacteria bacterium]NIW42316.1 DNA mismatch repair protein MutS [candidate division Zixibacteria bacterium]NIX55467.1 DNA mismatch repair protein MutS [candidate division Zixibacteria bacterium]